MVTRPIFDPLLWSISFTRFSKDCMSMRRLIISTPTPSSFRPTMKMQRCDIQDLLSITWSRSVTLCPFWCLAAKGGESVGICVVAMLWVCVSSCVFLCVLSVSLFGLVWCLWDLSSRHMVWDICSLSPPYYLCLFSTVVYYELHACPVLYSSLIYLVLRIVGL